MFAYCQSVRQVVVPILSIRLAGCGRHGHILSTVSSVHLFSRPGSSCSHSVYPFGRPWSSCSHTVHLFGRPWSSCSHTVYPFGRPWSSCSHTVHPFGRPWSSCSHTVPPLSSLSIQSFFYVKHKSNKNI